MHAAQARPSAGGPLAPSVDRRMFHRCNHLRGGGLSSGICGAAGSRHHFRASFASFIHHKSGRFRTGSRLGADGSHVSDSKRLLGACRRNDPAQCRSLCKSRAYAVWHGRRSGDSACGTRQRSEQTGQSRTATKPSPRPQDRCMTGCRISSIPRGSSEQAGCATHARWASIQQHA